MFSLKRIISLALILAILIGVILISFSLAHFIENNPAWQEILTSYGYFGAFLTAFILGISAVLPIPAGTFAPIFIAGGLSVYLLIPIMAIGTLCADWLGYVFGKFSRSVVSDKYPKLIKKLEKNINNNFLLIPSIIGYAAFVPLPNEILVIIYALLGVRFKILLIPLLIGNMINHTVFTFGFYNLFLLFN